MNSRVLHDHFIAAIRGAKENGWTEGKISRAFLSALNDSFDGTKSEPVLLIDCLDAGKIEAEKASHAE